MDVERLIGWNFRRLRMMQELSQEEMALRLESVDQAYISQLESGGRNPTGRTIYRLARVLGVNPGELFSMDGVPEEIVGDPDKIEKSISVNGKRKR